MGAIGDTRKVLQDFLAPELRAIAARLDALEKRFDGVDHRFDRMDTMFDKADQRTDKVEQKLEKGLIDLDRRAEQRHELVMLAVGRLVDYTEVRDRLARLESRDTPHQ